MKSRKLVLAALVAIFAVSFTGEAFARGGRGAGGGQSAGTRLQMRDGSCATNPSSLQTRSTQQMSDGSGVNAGSARQGSGQGSMRQLGPGDGTGNTTRPMDGTGYGSPAK